LKLSHHSIYIGGATSKGGDEDPKIFYALGVNIARQVGGDLKGVLSAAELESLMEGFQDSIRNKIADERSLLLEFGPKINEILQARSGQAIEGEKTRGADFLASYLLKNPKAVKTSSGLVYHETLAGLGKQVCLCLI
jgi:hypothetical protein